MTEIAPRFLADDPRFVEALAYACRMHADQTRKSTDIPYVAHLLGVASLAIEYGANMDEAIGALLHDVIEDCGAEYSEEIKEKFGDEVFEIVNACSDSFVTPKPPWVVRKTKYIAHLQNVSRSVLLVSAADKLYNARSILKDLRVEGEGMFSRFSSKNHWTIVWYYSRLSREFVTLGVGEIALELERVVRKIEKKLNDSTGRAEVFAELDSELQRAKVTI
jgi:(p)ppGpp synthase/HD superfamily hydrolase